jgi:hypothetical protein
MASKKQVAKVRKLRSSETPTAVASTATAMARRGIAVEALRDVAAQGRAADRAAQAARKQREEHVQALQLVDALGWASDDGAVTRGFGIACDELTLRLNVEGHGARLSETEARAFGGWLRAMLGAMPQA